MWLKVNEAKDVISYKKADGVKTTIIEARLEDSLWKIYKTYQVKGINKLVKEYTAHTKNEALSVIDHLKGEKEISSKKIDKIVQEANSIHLHMHRDYKEYDVEKWNFSVNTDKKINFVIIRYADEVIVDIVLHDKFKGMEKSILNKLFSTLNLDEIGASIIQNVYFFSDENHSSKESKKGMLIGKIEMDFGMEEDE